MADTEILSANNSTVQKWSALLYKSVVKQLYFGRYVGTSEDSVIQKKTDLIKEKGDKISFALRRLLAGAGRFNDDAVETHEEALVFDDFLATVVLWGNGVRAKGKMSERRPAFSLKAEMQPALSDWMAEKMDVYTTLALSGLATGLEVDGSAIAAVAPSTNRKWFGGQTITEVGTASVLEKTGTTDATIDSATDNLFGPKVISAIKRKAELATPTIRPAATIDGKKYYVMLIHPYQAKALKADGEWRSEQLHAAERGMSNPLFTGMLGVHDGVVVHEYSRIETRLGAGGTTASEIFEAGDGCYNGIYVARALFLGAQAGVHAYAQYPGWYEKNFEYGRVPGVWTDVIMAIQKTVWNSEDYAVITVDTAYVPD